MQVGAGVLGVIGWDAGPFADCCKDCSVPDSSKPRDAFQKLVMEAAGITVKAPAAKKK